MNAVAGPGWFVEISEVRVRLMTDWKLIPRKGIEQGNVAIHFGMSRTAIRDLLGESFPAPVSHFENEDDFEHATDGTLIRVRYDDSGVRDIEFLDGVLVFDSVKLSGGGDWPEVQQELAQLGNKFRESEWLGDGTDCLPLAINVATHEQIGGDGDGIEWVILSSNFIE